MSGVFLTITMYRVLIVDDEIPFLESLAAFHWENYECECIGKATNGEEALNKCMQVLPHIVITDINMPLLDGLSFLSKLHEIFPEIQVILLTVHQKFDYARFALQSGASDYVIKTMDYQAQLIMALENAKKYFINNSISLDSRYNLLYKGGRILIIESEEVNNNYKSEMEDFFNKKYNTLISVYCQVLLLSLVIRRMEIVRPLADGDEQK
jgi:YesN/AraC family two-component response regulator